jgi:hypothetical protein
LPSSKLSRQVVGVAAEGKDSIVVDAEPFDATFTRVVAVSAGGALLDDPSFLVS